MRPKCPLCGSPTDLLHPNLHDDLYGSIGVWHLHRCSEPDCGLGSLQPPPTSADILAAYESYHTHSPDHGPVNATDGMSAGDGNGAMTFLHNLWQGARERYQARRFGYTPAPRPVLESTLSSVLSWLITLLPGHRADFAAAAFYLHAPQELQATTSSPTARPQLLEVGCGSGKILSRMQNFGWQVTGTDFDDNAVMAARSRDLDVRSGTLAAQNFAPASFDAIVLKHVLEHVPEPVAELALCNHLLKPGGKLIVMTPNLAGLGHDRWQRHWRGLEPPRHLQIFTPPALRTALINGGLSVQELSTTGRTRSSYRASLDAQRLTAGKGNLAALPSLVLAELDEWLEALMRLRDPLCGNELLAIATASLPAAEPAAAQPPTPQLLTPKPLGNHAR